MYFDPKQPPVDTSEAMIVPAHAGKIAISDPQALFGGHYAKDGQDLVISFEGVEVVRVSGYFELATLSDLVSPKGNILRAADVVRLAGVSQDLRLAQADGDTDLIARISTQGQVQPIGQVESFSGTATVTRADGTVVTLSQGDLVYQNDVVETAVDGELSLTFLDGTIFSLTGGSRMILDELIFDPDGSDNSAVFNLIQGSFVFIAGQVATTGGIDVETPAATVGIRGTTVFVQIVFDGPDPEVTISLEADPDGAVGRIELTDLDGNPITTIDSTDTVWVISPADDTAREILKSAAAVPQLAATLTQAVDAFVQAEARVESGDTYVTGDTVAPDTAPQDQGQDLAPDGPDTDGVQPGEGGSQGPGGGGDAPATPLPQLNQPGADDGVGLDATGGDSASDTGTTTTPSAPTQSNLNFAPVSDDTTISFRSGSTGNSGTLTASDVDGDALTFAVQDAPANGTVIVDADTGAFEYIPAEGFVGEDSFTFVVSDERGAVSDVSTVTVTVDPPNQQPVLPDSEIETGEDSAFSGAVVATDSEGDALRYSLSAEPENGSATVNEDGTFTYVPNADFFGSDTFSISVDDGEGGVTTAQVTVVVDPVSDQPEASDRTETVDEDASVNGAIDATDRDGDALTFAVASDPANGAVLLNTDGTYQYTPNSDFFGADSFEISVTDAVTDPITVTVTVDVSPRNDVPVITGDARTIVEDSATSGVIEATDADGDALTFSLVSGAENGTAAIGPNGSYTYTPAADFFGEDSFVVQVSDGAAEPVQATVTITVTPVNDAPIAPATDVTTQEDGSVSGAVGASDPDGDPLTYTVLTGVANGTLDFGDDGTFTYTPDADFSGTDSFDVSVSDGENPAVDTTVTITVTPENDAPVLTADAQTIAEDTVLTAAVSATDRDGDPLTFTLASPASNGVVELAADGTYTYTPAPNFFGNDGFLVAVSDGTAEAVQAVVDITVTAVEDAPIAVDQTLATDEDTSLEGSVIATDADGDLLTYTVTSPATLGVLDLRADGTFLYTPDANIYGVDGFDVTVTDGSGASDSSTITINVASVIDPATIDPITGDDFLSVAETAAPVTVTGSAEQGADVRVTLGEAQQTVSVDGSGLFSVAFQPTDIPDTPQADVTIEVTDTLGNPGATVTRVVDIEQPANVLTITAAGATTNFANPSVPAELNIPATREAALIDVTDSGTPVLRTPVTSTTEIRYTADDGRSFAFTGIDLDFAAGTGLVTGIEFGTPTDPDFVDVEGFNEPLSVIQTVIDSIIVGNEVDFSLYNALFQPYSFVFIGSDGNDQFDLQDVIGLQDVFFGGGGNDEFSGGLGDDQFFGGDGDDYFFDAFGSNLFDGEGGDFNQVSYNRATGPVNVDLNTGVALKADGTSDTLINITFIRGSLFNDTIQLLDGAGFGVARGLAGDDTLLGGIGGFDEVRYDRDAFYSGGTMGVTVNLQTGVAIDGTGGTDSLSGFESAMGTAFNDVMTAADTGSRLIGLDGDDRFITGAGNDEIDTGAGNDTVVYSDGEDVLTKFNVIFDSVELAGRALDNIDSLQVVETLDSTGAPLFSFQFTDSAGETFNLYLPGISEYFANIEAQQTISATLAPGQTILGTAGDDFAAGTSGDDTINLFGNSAGRDLIAGSAGDDTLIFSDNSTDGYQEVTYRVLADGTVTANIDANAMDSTVLKGAGLGTDTLVDVQSAAQFGLGLIGTLNNDTFNITQHATEQGFIGLFDSIGNDTVDIQAGTGIVRLSLGIFSDVVADLGSGTATSAAGNSLSFTITGDRSDSILEFQTYSGNDSIIGTDDPTTEERYILGPGNDTVDGGAGFDLVRYDRSEMTEGLNIDLGAATITGNWGDEAFTHTLINIEGVRGTRFSDVLTAADSGSFLGGRGGDDSFVTGLGDDTVDHGGDSSDTLILAGGNDIIRDFSVYDDTVVLADGSPARINADSLQVFANTVNGEASQRLEFTDGMGATFGADFIGMSSFSANILEAQVQSGLLAPGQSFLGSDGEDTFAGTSGDDTFNLTNNNGEDVIVGSDGNDVVTYNALSDSAFQQLIYRPIGDVGVVVDIDLATADGTVNKGAGAGIDTLVNVQSSAIVGGGVLIGGTFGDDTFNYALTTGDFGWLGVGESGGNDTINITGGDGIIRISKFFGDDVTADLAAGTVTSSSGSYTLNYIGDLSNTRLELRTDNGDDNVAGTDAKDRFILGAGTDVADGRGDRDLVRYDRSDLTSGVVVNLAAQIATGTWDGIAFEHTLINIEDVRGSRFDDTITMSNSDGNARGEDGNDTIITGTGNDTVEPGAGADEITYAEGFDTIIGFNAVEDTLILAGRALANLNTIRVFSNDAVFINGSRAVSFRFDVGAGEEIGVDIDGITIAEGLELAGSYFSFTETFTGTNGADTFLGTPGDDVVNLLGNNDESDIVVGSAGNDTYIFTDNSETGFHEFQYGGLTEAITVNVDSLQIFNTVDKGPAGTDTLFNAQKGALWGIQFDGTPLNDQFNITLHPADFSWYGLSGGGGADTVNLQGGVGTLRIQTGEDNSNITANLATGDITSTNGDTISLITSGITDETRIELYTFDGNDTVIGSPFTDRFILGAGNDLADGAGGIDLARYDRSQITAEGVTIVHNSAFDQTATGTWGVLPFTHTLLNIEEFRGSNLDDTITVLDPGVNIQGRGGNDTITGGGGGETIDGGDGEDLITSTSADAILLGGSGDDTLERFEFDGGSTDGGTGRDSLAPTTSGSFDFSAVSVASRYSSVEVLTVEGEGTETLTLSLQNIFDFSQTADALLDGAFSVLGDVGDVLRLSNGDFVETGTTTNPADGQTMNVYQGVDPGTGLMAALAVDTDVTVEAGNMGTVG